MSEDDNFKKLLGINIDAESLRFHAKRRRMLEGKGCASCDYNGFVTNYLGKTVMCSCVKDKFFKELFVKANVPEVYIGKTIDDWNTRTDSSGNDLGIQQKTSENIFKLLKFYEKNINNIVNGQIPKIFHTGSIRSNLHSILFDGNIGSGKTFIASTLVQSSIRQGLSSKYYDWSDLIQTLSDFDKKEETEHIIEEFKNLHFIALDGIEHYGYQHPILPQQLDRLSRARLNSGKPIILLSYGNINQITGGSGWNSLLKSCLHCHLPKAIG
jgi:DNA replication protein DnaC